jgi:hypothetical protein
MKQNSCLYKYDLKIPGPQILKIPSLCAVTPYLNYVGPSPIGSYFNQFSNRNSKNSQRKSDFQRTKLK